LFALPTSIFEICGHLIYRWKGLENTFPMVYYKPKKCLELHLKKRKEKSVVV
jgi:hypothetical protein